MYDGEVKAVGGIRTAEWLAGGKYLEIEYFVAKENERSKAYGGELFDWIVDSPNKWIWKVAFLSMTPFLDRAVRLYEKFGFMRNGDDDLYGTPLIAMEKRL